MDQEPRPVRVRSSSESTRGPSILIALAVVFVVLAIVKPWSIGSSGSGSASPPAARASGAAPGASEGAILEPSATARIDDSDPNALACMADDTEQLVTIARWSGQEVRSWVAATDVAAPGPRADRLAPIAIFSTHLVGLGVCAPRTQGAATPSSAAAPSGPAGASARLIDVRAINQTTTGPVEVDLGVPTPLTGLLSGPDLAVLYGPPAARRASGPLGADASDGPTGSSGPTRPRAPGGPPTEPAGGATPSLLGGPAGAVWAPGSYAIAFRFDPDAPSVVRWLRIDIVKGAGEPD